MKTKKASVHPAHTPSAPERARMWIGSRIRKGLWRPGEKLPTLETLAVAAGVSRHTMWKVIAALVDEKVLITKRGSGISLAGEGEGEIKQRDSLQNISRQVTEAVLAGDFLPGTMLPPLSKLQIRFNACYRTMHKALMTLVSRGILAHTGTRYTVPLLHAPGSTLEVVLINEEQITNERKLSMIPVSEQQAQKIGISIVRHEYSLLKPFNTVELRRISSRDTVAGFIVDFWGMNTADRGKYLQSLLTILYTTHKPIAIIDQVGDLELAEPLHSSGRVRVFTIAARVAGEEVGRNLLNLGHRRAAFLTSMGGEIWSQRRFAGLRQIFEAAGRPENSVTFHDAGTLPEASALVCAAARLSPGEIECLFLRLQAGEEFKQLLERVEQTSKKLQMSAQEIEWMRRHVKPAIDLCKAGGEPALAESVRARIFTVLGDRIHRKFLQPFFRKLLEDPSITAWVAVTDGIGRAALHFLHENRIDVPGRISVVAFDNEVGSRLENLSSYEFDMPGLLHQTMSFAAGRAGTAIKVQRVVEWPGILFQRQSSGRAPDIPR
jgi:DNA-binding LacI/PurR family transcriptional regulator/DNA-binding transcriptional regulator YhcF (GntR family)